MLVEGITGVDSAVSWAPASVQLFPPVVVAVGPHAGGVRDWCVGTPSSGCQYVHSTAPPRVGVDDGIGEGTEPRFLKGVRTAEVGMAFRHH
jgi:hypothetical protein